MTRAMAGAPWLRAASSVRIIAAGKAAPEMAAAAAAVLGPRLRAGVVVASRKADVPSPLELVVGAHPQPGEGSLAGGRRALEVGRAAAIGEQLLVLLSGGASSLMAVPASGLTLDDKSRATAILLRAGADIHALNTVRKHMSAIKGGWLAAASMAQCMTLAVSDVVGDDMSVIASGPTVPDASTFAEAQRILQRSGGLDAFPKSLTAHLEAGIRRARDETPKPGDPRLARSSALVIGGRKDAMRGAEQAAIARGYRPVVLEAAVVGEARVSGRAHVQALLDRIAALPGPLCVISSGETTVTVAGQGRGGRNQEFALAAAEVLAADGRLAALASVGTDGIDGPTDAAGAIADSTTIGRARTAGLAAAGSFLGANNSYEFFSGLGDLIQTGPTGTNVGDLQVILLA